MYQWKVYYQGVRVRCVHVKAVRVCYRECVILFILWYLESGGGGVLWRNVCVSSPAVSAHA